MAVPPYVTAGTAIEEAWGDQIADAVVNPFATSAARSSAITAPTTGMTTALTAANTTNGLEVYNGVQFNKSWNMPWGVVGVFTPASFNFNNVLAFSTVFSFDVRANRRYKFSITGRFDNGAVTGVIDILALYLNTGTVLIQNHVFTVTQTTASGQNAATGTTSYVPSATATSVGFKLGAQSTASATNQQYVTTNIIVEDIGPTGAPA